MLRQRAAVATDVPPNLSTTVFADAAAPSLAFVVVVVVVVAAGVAVVVMGAVVAKAAVAVNAARRQGEHGADLRYVRVDGHRRQRRNRRR
jgi:hypothetical protein